jgi:MoaA/NifB/PqqE/SkfB family radical SAM enzyme
MSKIKSISWAILPNNAPSFLLDWELTLKCNLDCTYCLEGPEGTHDNNGKHPPLEECLESIDFMYEYVDEYMKQRKSNQRKVVLNVYGGEALFHPDIVEILEATKAKYEQYKERWHLTITTTTNGIINKSIWKKITPLIDEFTISYHAENYPKQEKLFFENLLTAEKSNSRVKCVIMMHDSLWDKSMRCVEFCEKNNIRHVAKPFDNPDRYYTKEQFSYFENVWGVKTTPTLTKNDQVISIHNGRPCCGGRCMSLNNDLKSRVTYIPRQNFQGWKCSVNHFFLYVRQISREVFVNKDCKMKFDGEVGPIGSLDNTKEIVETLKLQMDSKMPTITCAKKLCSCGICAPKADNNEDFKELMSRTLTNIDILEI